jgi:phage N-6-adenine-methyltransferase
VESQLVRYDAARAALTEARNVDEVKDIRDRAEAVRIYARQAKDTELEELATEIRLRAERRAGEMLVEERAAGRLAVRGDNQHTAKRDGEVVPDRYNLLDLGVSRKESGDWGKLAALDKDEFETRLAKIKETKAAIPTATLLRMSNVAANSVADGDEGNDWYTPAAIVEAARALMGVIDLDPASSDAAQGVVSAGRFFTKENDGLAQEWAGKVFLNPPYSYPLVERFATKLTEEYDAGRVAQAVLLVNNCTDAAWFVGLSRRFPLMFTIGRCAFWRPGTNETFAARQGQALFYLGPRVDAFFKTFAGVAYAPNAAGA